MELLAPAGNMECLKAAVLSGADAVYFAGKNFGARSFADNFSDDEIREAAKYCRLRSVKTYVTVNTMMFDREFKELDSFICLLAEAGVDGVIVQDLGVMRRIQSICPELLIHASTQMTVHNLAGVCTLENMGVKRVVLARELSEKDIRYISENCGIELELFVHGAMCMSYSGQCLMSSVLGGRSGNRGKCAQPCRLNYSPSGGSGKFYLSLKDMSLIQHLSSMKEIGIASLKIEGRMKGTDYVSETVSIYRSCIDQERLPYKEEIERLNKVFYRGGLTDGYFTDKTGPKMFAFDKPDNPYAKGGAYLPEESKNDKKIKVYCKVILAEGTTPEITLSVMGQTVHYCGDAILEPAMKNPARPDDARKQLYKTGGTIFEFEPVEVEIKGSPFVPVKSLNELRRSAVGMLEELILEKGKKQMRNVPFLEGENKSQRGRMLLTASVQNMEQFEAIKDFPFVRIDMPLDIVYENKMALLQEKERIVIRPNVIVKDGVFAETVETLKELRELGFCNLRVENICWLNQHSRFNLFGGYRLNTANSMASEMLSEQGMKSICLSPELNLAQIRDMYKPVPAEAVIYGHIPLMITENCLIKNMGNCPCSGSGEIYDRKGKKFPVIRDGKECRSVVLNGVPLYMGDKRHELSDAGIDFGLMLFTVETPERCTELCRDYLTKAEFDGEYTRLHFYKGVI